MENKTFNEWKLFLRQRIYILIFIVAGMFLSLLSNQLIIIYLNKSYHYYGYFFFPIYIALFYAIAIATSKASSFPDLINAKNSSSGDRLNNAVSIIYAKYLRKKYLKISFSLIFIAVTIELYFIFLELSLIKHIFNLALIVCSLLLLFRLQIVTSRIQKGIFGTNKNEARELILFIINNADEIDFTNDDGRPKRAFLPEKLISEYGQLPNGSGVLS